MTGSPFLRSARLHRIAVSHRTTWFVTEITTSDGVTGLGECSDLRDPELAESVLTALAPALSSVRPEDDLEDVDERLTDLLGPTDDPAEDFLRRLVIGSVMTALVDVAARTADQPLWQWLGASRRDSIPIYANINRAPVERRSDEFATAAAAAVHAGFSHIKLAPFDGPAIGASTLLETGIAHLHAVREAIGFEPTMYVDVHHRLSRPDLIQAIEVMEQLGVGWIEDAVDVRSPADLHWLRAATDIPLAGGEKLTDRDQVAGVVKEGVLDYLLLDPKYVGGPLRLRALLDVVHDVAVTFHDPTSPISTAVSGHLASLPKSFAHVEYAFGEPIDRRTMVEPAEELSQGTLTLAPGAGIGTELTVESLGERVTTTEWLGQTPEGARR